MKALVFGVVIARHEGPQNQAATKGSFAGIAERDKAFATPSIGQERRGSTF
jgi:hypothetical protein